MRKYIYLLALTLVLAIGCDDSFLDTAPTDAISDAAAFDSPENMMLVLNGLHRQMYAQNPLSGATWSRTGESHFIPSLDAIGGSIIHSSPGNGWMTADLQWRMHTTATSTTLTNFWYQRYHFIASANAIINNVAERGFALDGQVKNILGQAHAYRAWAYWRLVTTFAKGYIIGNPSTDLGVPLLLEQGPPYESGPRATVAEVYEQIEKDIDQAIEYLEEGINPGSGDNAKSHISVNAAYGIKARVALSKGDWATAAEAAALARDGYPLMSEEEWLSGFNTLDLPEVIWGGHVIDTETNYFASYFYYVSPTFNGSQNRSNPKLISKELYDNIPATDFRRKAWLPLAPNTNPAASNGQGGSYESDPNYNDADSFWAAWEDIITTYGMTNGHNTHPYMNVKFLQKNPGTIDPDDVIYMRSAEMVLIEAEAYAMLNDIPNAQSALRELGEARDSNYDVSVFDTQEKLMEEIKFQRRVELWGEGFSYHDHIRWDEPLDHTNSGASSVLYGDGFYQDRPSVNDDWIWKIPQSEIDTNPYITENEQN